MNCIPAYLKRRTATPRWHLPPFSALPAEGVLVKAELSGGVAGSEVRKVYQNRLGEWCDALTGAKLPRHVSVLRWRFMDHREAGV